VHFYDPPANRRQSCTNSKRRTCSAFLSELIRGVVAIITAHRYKIIALAREEQVRLSPLFCSEFQRGCAR
jgi:hypothetical protein